jgi:fucose permease
LSQAEETSFSRVAFVAALGAFLLIGSIDAAYGLLLRPIATRFGVSLPVAGTVISVYFAGALVSVPVVLAAFRRGPPHRVAVAALAVLAVGCLAISLAGAWLILLAAVLVSGLGFGATDFGLNQLGARTAADGRAARLTILNAAFGAGAILGPVIVSQLGEQALTAGFAAAAGLACVLAIGLRGIRERPAPGVDDLAAGPVGFGPLGDVPLPASPEPAAPAAPAAPVAPAAPAAPVAPADGPGAPSPGPVAPGPQPAATTRRRGLVALAGLGYLLYVACEAGVAGWIPAQLASVGYRTSFAAGVTSGFWAAMTVGRLLVVPVSRVVPARRIVLAACVLLLAVLTLTALPAAAPAAYVAAGLAAAPVFPVGLAWVGAAFPGQRHATSWALTGALVGGVIGPAVVAAVVSVAGLPAVPAVLSALAAGTLLVFLAIWRVAAE